MPSLWKKHKGTRFSKLVADLQTPLSKRDGGSLVVETGFPTSIVDLFVKNRDKLKKQKKSKKYKSKNSTISEYDNDYSNYDQGLSVKARPGVGISDNDSDYNNTNKSCSDFDDINGPACSIAKNNDQEKGENFEENIVTTDSSLEDVSSLESTVEFDDNCSKFEVKVEEKKVNYVVVFNSRSYVMLLSILMGAVCFGVVLFAKNWFLALITLGVLLLLLLKNCENNARIKSAKVALVVLVVLNTKCLVAGVTLGVCLLILLECVGNSIFGFLKFCRIARGTLQGILANWGGSNKEDGTIWSRDFVQERPTRNCQIEEVGDEIDIKGESNSVLIEDEKQDRPSFEIMGQESDDSKDPKSSDYSSVSCVEEGEELKLDKQGRKAKKNRKFWKKLMFKKRSNKRKKRESYEGEFCVLNSDIVPDIPPDIEEDEQGVSEGELSASTRSRSTACLTDGEESGADKSESGKVFITEPLHLDNKSNDSSSMVKEGYENMKYVIAVVIPLIGLIRSRVLAIVFTVICCLVIKMAKKLRKTSIEN